MYIFLLCDTTAWTVTSVREELQDINEVNPLIPQVAFGYGVLSWHNLTKTAIVIAHHKFRGLKTVQFVLIF